MGRVWRPVRFFAEEDGKQKPTLLFLIFAVLIGIGAWAGGILIWRDVQSQRYADSILTRTPTVTATITPTATVTLTPTITLTPSVVPSSTPYVYSDPATWELVQKTDPNGVVYMDLQDWQKEQVWHFFTGFWNMVYHNPGPLVPWEYVEPLLLGTAREFVQLDYELGEEKNERFCVQKDLRDIQSWIVIKEWEESSYLVILSLYSDIGFKVDQRDNVTGEIVKKDSWLPITLFSFEIAYQNDSWILEAIYYETYQ